MKPGQASLLHLAKFIHIRLLPLMREKAAALKNELAVAAPENKGKLLDRLLELDRLDAETLYRLYLSPAQNPDLPNPEIPTDDPDTPRLLKYNPCELLRHLAGLRSGYRVTLNLSNLWAEDVLELLYDCEGMITRLEIFNLKDHAENKVAQIPEINELQGAVNEGNVIKLKRVIRGIIDRVAQSDTPDREARLEKLNSILHDILTLKSFYKSASLKSRIGSDSTGHSSRMHGMGLAVVESLPYRARRQISRSPSKWMRIPFTISVHFRSTYIPLAGNGDWLARLVRRVGAATLFRPIFHKRRDDWIALEHTTRMTASGNIITLGGIQDEGGNGFMADPAAARKNPHRSWTFLNTRLKILLKIAAGFAPAFATFAWSYHWPLLKYGGAPIWFGITGVRNIVQSVLGGGGLRRSPLLRWNDYISWERLSDSLLFTGFSVPLLDLFVKTLFLQNVLDITIATNPALLYTIMALANGLYLSTHNAFRGLPKGAIVGNFFRSVISIPIAILFNLGLTALLSSAGITGVDQILQKWAAIISKAASDIAAGLIEGSADRYHNIRLRTHEYKAILDRLIEAYSNLELCFPDTRVLEMLKSMDAGGESPSPECRELENVITAHALDLLYFWMYQPRARTALKNLVKSLSDEELRILVGCQQILKRNREISQLFIDGMVGRNFSKGLSFYLNHNDEYLATMQKIMGRCESTAEQA